jgi:hypothetical protein
VNRQISTLWSPPTKRSCTSSGTTSGSRPPIFRGAQGLERAVATVANADCWAVLSLVYAHDYGHGFNALPGSLQRAEAAARRAVDLAPGNHLAHQALSTVSLYRVMPFVAGRHRAKHRFRTPAQSRGDSSVAIKTRIQMRPRTML